jgi:hypothetical protein
MVTGPRINTQVPSNVEAIKPDFNNSLYREIAIPASLNCDDVVCYPTAMFTSLCVAGMSGR